MNRTDRLQRARVAFVASTSVFWPISAFSQSMPDQALSEQVRQLAGPLAERHLFAGVILIERSDGSRTEEAFGLADVESNRPVTADTRFCIASTTKPMTQIVFAQLMAEGKLSGDDLASKYLPGFPKGPSGVEATVQMLLDHRAGVPHRVTKPFEEAERWTPQRIVSRLGEIGLQFDPGTKRSYTSAGYTCLARIAEIVEGKPYGQILRQRVFDPAGMVGAVDPAPREIVPLAARDYLFALDARGRPALERAHARDFAFLAGAGSVWATAEDLARLVRALRSDKLGPGAFDRLTASQTGPWITADGLTGGFASSLMIHRESGAIVVCLSNTRGGAFLELVARLRELVESGQALPVSLQPDAVTNEKLLDDLCGTYALGDETYTLERVATAVRFQDSTVYPMQGGKLFWPYWYAELRPVRGTDGRVTAIEAVMGDRTMRYERK